MSNDKPGEIERELDDLEQAARQMRPDTPPGPRGPEARRARMRAAREAAANKQMISIRLDADILHKLKQLAGEGSYQALINRALAQWCDAIELGGLLEEKIARLEQATARLEGLPATEDTEQGAA